jgi:BON domain
VSTSATIEDDIREALEFDPRIPDPEQVAISAEDGAVTLRGTVGSFSQRRAAVADARKAHGVYDVFDELQVRLLDDARRDDADIRGIAPQMLMWDNLVAADSIDVRGQGRPADADRRGQLSDRERRGVRRYVGSHRIFGVTNEIKVITP